MIEADSVHSTPPLSMPTDVNKHRSGTPGLREANRLIWFVNLADNRGPDRRRSGPHPKRIFSCYIKALRPSELGSRFGVYSQSPLDRKRLFAVVHPTAADGVGHFVFLSP
jgi:hypothetical protein